MSFREKFDKWRRGGTIEEEIVIDLAHPKTWLVVIIIILFVLWLVK